jgi:chromatin segregation and condensation protein Rec8/ScpA/Scc1 (kleisin family)
MLERMTEILTLLRDTWSLLFSSMTGGERRRSEVVVSLLAVLELCRQGRIRTQQTELFGDIVIERRSEIPEPDGGVALLGQREDVPSAEPS